MLASGIQCRASHGFSRPAPEHRFRAMSRYFFSIPQGRFSGTSDACDEFADREAAWQELTRVCADMVGGISRRLGENDEWRVELLDESRKPVFRIRLVAETLD
jgi:hypothetical protein